MNPKIGKQTIEVTTQQTEQQTTTSDGYSEMDETKRRAFEAMQEANTGVEE